jgi:N-acetylmuramoyl-L-alanine amidase
LVVSGARLQNHGDIIEIHLATNRRARWNLSRHGDQLWLDFADARFDIPPRPLFGSESPPLNALRAVDQDGGNARLVIEVTEASDYAIAALPNELIIRLARAGQAADIAAPLMISRPPRPVASAAATTAGLPKLATYDTESQAARSGVAPASVRLPVERTGPRGKVVIDAGHGGYDPGTSSAQGLLEKDITLQIAKRVAEVLQRHGVAVELTRDSDTFVGLSQRTNAANRAEADLFVSIHANSSPRADTSGLEVYYLNNTTDRATIRLAWMENRDAVNYGDSTEPNLNYILSDLSQQYKATESSSLARMIDASVEAEMRSQFGESAHTLGAKKGPFYVLVGAHMPAVLVECGFLSNREEAVRLASPDYQQGLALGIADAVIDYLDSATAVGNL